MSLITNYNKNENFIISNMSRLTQNSNMKGCDVSYIEKKIIYKINNFIIFLFSIKINFLKK